MKSKNRKSEKLKKPNVGFNLSKVEVFLVGLDTGAWTALFIAYGTRLAW